MTTMMTMTMTMVSETFAHLDNSVTKMYYIKYILCTASEGYPSNLIPQVIISKTEGNYQHDTYATPDDESECAIRMQLDQINKFI